MTEKEILELIRKDEWMMSVLRAAQSMSLPDWMIGAGFVRNKAWDALHDFENRKVPTNDIDLIYFDKENTSEAQEKSLMPLCAQKCMRIGHAKTKQECAKNTKEAPAKTQKTRSPAGWRPQHALR